MAEQAACGNCGAPNGIDAVVCGTCGAILAAYTSPAGLLTFNADESARLVHSPHSHPLPVGSSLPAPSDVVTSVDASPAPDGTARPASPPASASEPDDSASLPQNVWDTTGEPPGGDIAGGVGAPSAELVIRTSTRPLQPEKEAHRSDAHRSPDLSAAPGVAASSRDSETSDDTELQQIHPVIEPGMLEPVWTPPRPPPRPIPYRPQAEDQLGPAARGGRLPSHPLPLHAQQAMSGSPRIEINRRTDRWQGRDPLAALSGQALVLAGLGLVLASCLAGALSSPASMPFLTLAVFCAGPAGMLLIVVGAVILVARHSRRTI